jgi:tRNA pseudouridine13 synthase
VPNRILDPMKIKCRPDDFSVEELPLVSPGSTGRYAFYRLTKRNMGTIEAVEAIARRWNLPSRRVSYAGLKDRHAATTQYVSIAHGPRQGARGPNFELEPLGYLPHPYGPKHFRGNRFAIVLRDLSHNQLEVASSEMAAVVTGGFPNYFDDQRFGSLGASGEFIGHAWLLGQHERALRLALAEPNLSDRAGEKARKSILRQTWGIDPLRAAS